MQDLATSLPDPIDPAPPVPVGRPRGTLIPSASGPGHGTRFRWAGTATGAEAGWVTATDVDARLRAVAARARFPGRTGIVLASTAMAFSVAVVPLWSVLANEFPESRVGYFAQSNLWIPFVAMAVVLLAWLAALDWRGVPQAHVPGLGHLAPASVAFLVTDGGMTTLVRHGVGSRRHDLLRSSVTRVTVGDEDADHVTVRLATPDGEVVMPWLPRSEEVAVTVAGWAAPKAA